MRWHPHSLLGDAGLCSIHHEHSVTAEGSSLNDCRERAWGVHPIVLTLRQLDCHPILIPVCVREISSPTPLHRSSYKCSDDSCYRIYFSLLGDNKFESGKTDGNNLLVKE